MTTSATYTPWDWTHDVEELAEGVLRVSTASHGGLGSSVGSGGPSCPPQSGTPCSPRLSPKRTARSPWSGRFLAWATTGRGRWRSGSQNTTSGTLPRFPISKRKGAGHDHEDKDQAPQPAQHDQQAPNRVRQPLRHRLDGRGRRALRGLRLAGEGGNFQHGVTELACRLISLHLRRGTPLEESAPRDAA